MSKSVFATCKSGPWGTTVFSWERAEPERNGSNDFKKVGTHPVLCLSALSKLIKLSFNVVYPACSCKKWTVPLF